MNPCKPNGDCWDPDTCCPDCWQAARESNDGKDVQKKQKRNQQSAHHIHSKPVGGRDQHLQEKKSNSQSVKKPWEDGKFQFCVMDRICLVPLKHAADVALINRAKIVYPHLALVEGFENVHGPKKTPETSETVRRQARR